MSCEQQIKENLKALELILDNLDYSSAELISSREINEIQDLFLSVGAKLRDKLPPAGIVTNVIIDTF
ncbi:hypothetical protein [Xenorhabdus szentirmaii]|uniref:Uncharacterized protein n=1 Tax=Xenorhabdus szentirmaii DSM 16338 TaxID=1427518 RepID=W1J1V7_9GAMM|nr:hypothetical protein [Xenorhabdus szentirmaii]PHM32059.1 hypothetical protein Xsze_02788 [Xenorhabdus szentirmaii DSM 16338]CDL83861.1 hypothetical protein XSR1_380025 [Xenorhabdus szentirmaii DSM 16338]